MSIAEVKFLEQLYAVLAIEPKGLYAALNREPSTAFGADPVRPVGREKVASEIILDQERLARKRADTEAVSRLLTDIFVEDVTPAVKIAPISKGNPAFKGLDTPHGRLLEKLSVNGALTRSIFDGDARALNLLPDGAMATINEWALDHFGEVIMDDGESVRFVASLHAALERMRVPI